MIIDEAFDSSDTGNRDKIQKLIEHMKTYFDWILVISHNDDIKNFSNMEIGITHVSDMEKQIVV
jgi:DNA repair exonuclease SbcCD ATPase subunit